MVTSGKGEDGACIGKRGKPDHQFLKPRKECRRFSFCDPTAPDT
jgi:hypothetical protein